MAKRQILSTGRLSEIISKNLVPFTEKTTEGWEVRVHNKPSQTAVPSNEEKEIVHKIMASLKLGKQVNEAVIRQICEEHRSEVITQDPHNLVK